MVNIFIDKSKVVPNDERRIAEVEKMIGARLPEDYRQFLFVANGVRPRVLGYEDRPVFVRVRWPIDAPGRVTGGEQMLHDPGRLLENWQDWSLQRASDLRWTLNNVERLPKDFIAIWDDPGGNFFLLGIRKQNYGKVFFQDNDFCSLDADGKAIEDSLAFVANSFTDFIQMIEPEPDDWDLWEAAGKPRLPLSTEELEALARKRAQTAEKPPLPNYSAEKVRGARKEASGEKSTGE